MRWDVWRVMRKMTVTVEMSVKTLLDIDVLEDLIEDVLLEALHQDEEVEVKVTAELVKQPILLAERFQ